MDKNSQLRDMNLFRAPAARAAKTLDRSVFAKTLNAAAASISENRLLSKYRKELEKTQEVLFMERFNPILPDPDPSLASQGRKCIVLSPQIKPASPETWSPILQEASKLGELKVVPYDLEITYDFWNYFDVIKSILPEELHGEIPSGFNTVGHVAHLNIRDQYLPYKNIIAQVLLDKNPHIKTVINKTDNVGSENEFRTFAYEVLGGPDDMNVEVSEAGCTFRFDYSKVYWNSKLDTEHKRITSLFKPGEVVADVMAGIGPFAVPAGKKGVFVWANDKNPESHRYLEDAIRKNKVSEFVKPFNYDGHDFIRTSADLVLEASKRGDCAVIKPPRPPRKSTAPPPEPVRVPVPPTISHFVMNLPASAIEFLHNYRGLYHGHEDLFEPHTEIKLPIVHVHCFSAKTDDDTPLKDICERIHKEIGVMLKPGDAEKEGEVLIYDVRDVAPAKRMFCASFRLPREVAFAARA
ncbi:TRNA (guanine(37)-N1)-methyltransferase [Fusarium falciforme]|uniref:TRNA (guanine(37)-N1)-methyltransferase n=1 Tax=Fusarium falciforme TaxID=195108 RepID=UPI002301AA7D|nr:TRNA (guanine(37)-N1)-methyltransferase [Fusarium falciforme]WAO83422.1 TRNA (guanine(37)-N1)-methyltransferase [Fusarium falciforme]